MSILDNAYNYYERLVLTELAEQTRKRELDFEGSADGRSL